jgi:hypothetical protein
VSMTNLVTGISGSGQGDGWVNGAGGPRRSEAKPVRAAAGTS